jgi:tetratricopeptide (TPR) repeat protein
MKSSPLRVALATAGLATAATFPLATSGGNDDGDPLLQPGGAFCAPAERGQPALLRNMILAAKTETAPFQPQPAKPALSETPPLYGNLGKLTFQVSTRVPKAQAYFNQGIIMAFGFNHAEAQRAFREAQKLDPGCAICWWGESLVLGPNINVPMMPEAVAPAVEALKGARDRMANANDKEKALIEALSTRYSADPRADRAALDKAYADAMKSVSERFPMDDNIKVLYAEALMDTQPWDYWEGGGTKPKGNGAAIVAALEDVLKRNPRHPGAVHYYIHTVEASAAPERALPYADRLGTLVPGAGHLVHMPAHIYYRVGEYKKSLETNKVAMAVDEQYFKTSPSDPLYRSAYYPHNIHFVMVSAMMGGDRKTAIDAASKLDAAIPVEVAKMFAIMQPVKSAPYAAHAQFSDPDTILELPPAPKDLLLVDAMYHYSRAVAFAGKKDAANAKAEIAILAKMETQEADLKPFAEWQVPAKEVIQTARLVATGRLAAAQGDLDAAAKAYEDAVFIEDTLSYMEPPYWYYPVRQSLGAIKLRQGKLDEAEKAFRDSLARVRNNGWVLSALVETYDKKKDKKAKEATQAAFKRTWFGGKAPELARL